MKAGVNQSKTKQTAKASSWRCFSVMVISEGIFSGQNTTHLGKQKLHNNYNINTSTKFMSRELKKIPVSLPGLNYFWWFMVTFWIVDFFPPKLVWVSWSWYHQSMWLGVSSNDGNTKRVALYLSSGSSLRLEFTVYTMYDRQWLVYYVFHSICSCRSATKVIWSIEDLCKVFGQ